MPSRLFTTPRGTVALNTFATLVGIFLVIAIQSPRTGTLLFLFVIMAETTVFSVIYGLRSNWRREPAARAVFYFILSISALTVHAATLYASTRRFWWSDDLRELLYMAMAIAGLNLVLTLGRVLGRGVWSRHR
jgi:hypothetical protein